MTDVQERPRAPVRANRRFAGRTAFVTGGGSGIGACIVRRLHEEGANVTIADRDLGAAEAVRDDLGGERIIAVRCDVTSATAVGAAVRACVERFGELHLAVNNAGTNAVAETVENYPDEEWERVLSVNLTGVFLSLAHELRVIETGGSIVNISSIHGSGGWPGSAAYVASKHGVAGLTRSAALENAARGVRINAVAPGFIDTPMLEQVASPEEYELIVSLTPLGRMGTPDEVAALTLFLLSDEAGFVTGSYHLVDGAYAAQ